MAHITRYDPFEMTDSFDNLFRGFFRPVRLDKALPRIRMDVKEDETRYTVHADIPGVKKDDIHVTIDGNTVSISAEVRKNTEQKEGERVLRRERMSAVPAAASRWRMKSTRRTPLPATRTACWNWCCRKKRRPLPGGWPCSNPALAG